LRGRILEYKVGSHCGTVAAVTVAVLLFCAFLGAGSALAGWDEVAALFREARYAEAGAAADSLGVDNDSLQALYWRARLSTDPAAALASLRATREHPDCSDELAYLFSVEEAWILYARSEPDSALVALGRIDDDDRSGDAWLLAGMAERSLGRLEESRDAFASVVPADPEFAWARTFLGRLAQEEGDRVLAERYYRAAAEAKHPITRPALLAAAWEMDRAADPDAAAAIAEELYSGFPASLEAARLRDLTLRDAETEFDPVLIPAEIVPGSGDSGARTRRLSLQLAAFSDRGRALSYVDQWRDILPGLSIVTSRDSRGDVLYKVRSGLFVTRSQAQQESRRLESEHGLKVLLVEADEAP